MHFGLMTIKLLLPSLFVAVMPASGTYQLNNYGFGSGGTSNSSSATYKLNATTGEATNNESTSATYKTRAGNNNSQQAYVPVAPTFSNPSNFYNKLKFIINPGTSPTDTKFSIAISIDNFTSTQYVQVDDTIGPTRTYQTYAAWGGASGQTLVNLSPTTTYKMKASAIQGNFTETEFGPVAAAATVAPSISFDIDTAATDISTIAPYVINFTKLFPTTVVNSTEKIWVSLTTNAVSGAAIYIASANSGLKSSTTNFTIPSATADLAATASGYGAQNLTATQTSGGPLTSTSPYNGAGNNVGAIDTTIRQLFSTAAPTVGGRTSTQIVAKASITTKSASDYTDILTLTAAGQF